MSNGNYSMPIGAGGAGFGVRDILNTVMSNGDVIQQLMGGLGGLSNTNQNRPKTPQERFTIWRNLLAAFVGFLIRISMMFEFGQLYVQVIAERYQYIHGRQQWGHLPLPI